MDGDLWLFVLPGYLVTIAIETSVLLVALSASHKIKDRLIAGVWLTACTYPIVVLVMPNFFADFNESYWLYLLVGKFSRRWPNAFCLPLFFTPPTLIVVIASAISRQSWGQIWPRSSSGTPITCGLRKNR
jgi:hypothetical protein